MAAAVALAWQPWSGGENDGVARAGSVEPATPVSGDSSDEPAGSPPGGALDAALISQDWESSTVLHWSLASYDFSTASEDPNNGVALTGEVWIRIDDQGTPVEFIGRYATEEGTVVQAIHQTAESQTVAFAEPVLSGHPDGGVQCVVQIPSNPRQLTGVMPIFVDADVLRANGFVASSAEPPESVAGLLPTGGEQVVALRRSLTGISVDLEQVVRIGAADGRLATWHSVQRSGGVVTAEHIEGYGPVSVLPGPRMPSGEQVLNEVECDA